MKSAIVLVAGMLFLNEYILYASPDEKSSSGSWRGLITDTQCGKGHEAKTAPDAKKCALKCMANGAKLVLYEAQDDKIYNLSNQDLAKMHAGEHVTVKGKLEDDGKTIMVQEIK